MLRCDQFLRSCKGLSPCGIKEMIKLSSTNNNIYIYGLVMML